LGPVIILRLHTRCEHGRCNSQDTQREYASLHDDFLISVQLISNDALPAPTRLGQLARNNHKARALFSLMNEARPSAEQRVAEAPPPRILVVEDDILVRTVVSAYLRECGYDVAEAGNADEAIHVMKSDMKVDILFSDVSLPGSSLDGFG